MQSVATPAKAASPRNASARPPVRQAKISAGGKKDDGVELCCERRTEERECRRASPGDEQRQPRHGQKGGPRVVGVERDRPERDRRQGEQQHRGGQAPRRRSETHEQPRKEHQRREPAESHQRLEGGVVVRRAEGGRREEDRQCAGRILHEEIAVGNASVEDCVGKALVEMNVAKARSAKEPTVGDDAGPDVERDRGSREPQREATAGCRRREPGRSRRNCRFPSSSSSVPVPFPSACRCRPPSRTAIHA